MYLHSENWNFPPWFTLPSLLMESTDSCGKYNPQRCNKENVHAWKTSKRYIFLRENVRHIDRECRREQSPFWFGEAVRRSVANGSVLQPAGRTAQVEEGGRRGGRRCLFLALNGSMRVYCCKQEVGRHETGGKGGGAGVAARCLSYHIVWLSLSLFVCLSSHCRNQFALCGTVDKERKRLPGGLAQEKQQQTTRTAINPQVCKLHLIWSWTAARGVHLLIISVLQQDIWGLGGCR